MSNGTRKRKSLAVNWKASEGFRFHLREYGQILRAAGVTDPSPADFQWDPLPELCAGVRDMLPAQLRTDFEGIFIGLTPTWEINAWAYAPSKLARCVCISGGLADPLLVYSALFHCATKEIGKAWTECFAGQSGDADIGEYLDMLSTTVQRAISPFSLQPLVRGLAPLVGSWRTGSDSRMSTEDIMSLAAVPEVSALAFLAHTFIICHEVAHHFLAHSFRPGLGPYNYPAVKLLASERDIRMLRLPDDLNRSQRKEVDADLFAFLSMSGAFSGQITDPETAATLWSRAVLGAHVGLFALDGIWEIGGDRMSRGGLSMTRGGLSIARDGPTHPTSHRRIIELIKATVGSTVASLHAGLLDGIEGTWSNPIRIGLDIHASHLLMDTWCVEIVDPCLHGPDDCPNRDR